jgi:DNA-directed RNA polymerase subunit RPC12/RpoP
MSKYICDECGKHFARKENLGRHIANKVCKSKTYICKKCGHRYISKRSLRAHMKNTYNAEQFDKEKHDTSTHNESDVDEPADKEKHDTSTHNESKINEPVTEKLCIGHNNECGIVYIITSDIICGAKIGFWRSSLDGLRSRYITYYGDDVRIFYRYTTHARKLESMIHTHFEHMRITREIFKKEYTKDYEQYIASHQLILNV